MDRGLIRGLLSIWDWQPNGIHWGSRMGDPNGSGFRPSLPALPFLNFFLNPPSISIGFEVGALNSTGGDAVPGVWHLRGALAGAQYPLGLSSAAL